MVGLAEKVFAYPSDLSGGQKQRIAIARTLAMDPDIIMFDEPTSALDPTMVGEVEAVIRELAKTGKTMIIVTHEMNFARSISNRVFYMDEGGIYEDGTPEEIFEHPVREKTRRFVQKLKVLSLSITSRNYDFLNMATQIELYCNKNQIPPVLANRILLVFEELTQLLVSQIREPQIIAECEYSETDENAQWTFSYSGPQINVMGSDDELGTMVLKGMCESIDYKYNKITELPNQLSLKIRNI